MTFISAVHIGYCLGFYKLSFTGEGFGYQIGNSFVMLPMMQEME